jgi:hypothetical protein
MKSLNFTRNIFSILVLAFTFLLVGSVEGQVYWNGSSTNFTSCSISNLNDAIIGSTQGNNNGTTTLFSTTSASSGYTTTCNGNQSASGSSNFGAACKTGVLNTSSSTYFSIALTPNANFKVSLLSLCFGSRATSTGPSVVTIYSSIDNYQTALGSISLNPNSTWEAKTISFSGVNLVGATSTAVTLRIYGSGGTGSPSVNTANWRIDDLTINATAISSCSPGTWIGSFSGNWNTASNWCGGVPASGSNLTIPAGTTVTLDGTNEVTVGDLTINATGALLLPANAKLTVNGVLTNNGTLTLENNATIVQGASSTYSGSGIVQVKQTITGGNNGSSPNGRFWYLGSPVSGGLSSILDAAGANIVKYWDEQSAAWIEITDNTSALTVGRGHYLRSNTPGNHDLTFTGGSLNNGAYTFNLTANGSSFNGFNLVSNPYASYLKWDDVTKTNVGSTIWYRTSNGANNMVFDTYNSNGNVGTSNNGNGSVSQFIPPMQAFWVKVEGSSTGSITMDNLDRSHHISGMQGMHSMDSKLMFANLSLEKDSLRDQAIVYCSYETTDAQDAFDSEKMIQAGIPQLYSKIGDKKMVINAKNFMQRNEATPLYININNAGTHTIKLGEFNSTFGSIWLEDKTTQQFQNLLINDTYTFESQAGQDIARFVLHFGYPNQIYGSTEATDQPNNNPDEVINWADVSVGTSGSKVIELTANLNETEALQTKTMAIFDMTGRQVLTQSFESGNTQVYIPNANGVYLVQVQIGNTQKVFKVLIQE